MTPRFVHVLIAPLVTGAIMVVMGVMSGPFGIRLMAAAAVLLVVPSIILHGSLWFAQKRLSSPRSTVGVVTIEVVLWTAAALIGIALGTVTDAIPDGMTLEAPIALAWAYLLLPSAAVGVVTSVLFERRRRRAVHSRGR